MSYIKHISQTQVRELPAIKPGSTVRVHQKIVEINKDPKSGKETRKERVQVFEGLVIAKKGGNGVNATFTVRKITSGVGVERIYPIHSPNIEKVEVIRQPQVRKAKLYYVRGRQDNTPRSRKAAGKK